jgi:hypothetical protein
MRRQLLIAGLASFCLAAGCRHAQTVEDGKGEEKEAKADPSKKATKKSARGTGGAGQTGTTSENKKDERAPTEPGRPPLATSPEGLLVPGGVSKIQSALGERGFLENHRSDSLDSQTSAALRKFQEKEGLARTGAPDRETLRKLGLDPQELFRTTEKVPPPQD